MDRVTDCGHSAKKRVKIGQKTFLAQKLLQRWPEVICYANVLEFRGLVDRCCNRSRISLDWLSNRSLS